MTHPFPTESQTQMKFTDMDIYVRSDPHVHALQLTEGREDGWIAVVTDGNGQHIVSRAHVKSGLDYALTQHPTATAHPVLTLTGLDRPLALGDWIVSDGYGYEVVPQAKFERHFAQLKAEKAKEEPKVDKAVPPPPKEVFVTPKSKDGK